MWREFLRVPGLLLIGFALVNAFCLWLFRFDDHDEYIFVLRMDALAGLMFAVGLVLLTVPSVGMNTRRRRWIWLGGSLLAGLLISGGLLERHYEQHRFRSQAGVVTNNFE